MNKKIDLRSIIITQDTIIKQCKYEPGKVECCVGQIRTHYNHLVSKLGAPRHVEELSGDKKITIEWRLQFGDDVFKVYDYKESVFYGEGRGNLLISEIRASKDITWSIGGAFAIDPQKFIEYIIAE